MSDVDRDRLERLLGRPELQRLVDRLQRRLERGEEAGGAIHLSGADAAERRAVESLLGRPAGRGMSLQVRPEQLEEVLRRSGVAPDLRSAVAALRGPLQDVAAEKERQAQAWQAVFSAAEKRIEDPALRPWLDEVRRSGLLRRLSRGSPKRAGELLDQAFAVLRALPAAGISLSRLAAHSLGDAHALDPGRPVAALVRRAIAAGGHLPKEDGVENQRELWAAVGVLIGGGLSSTVLVCNLPVLAEGATGQSLAHLASAGEPGWLTLRQLLRHPPHLACSGKNVFICENPAVVFEAIETLGHACPPLICTNGQRNTSLTTLLRQLAEAGARLFYHGDFDWPGIAIANGIFSRFPTRPWRFDHEAYRSAAARSGRPLAGAPVAAFWDEALAPVMAETGRAVDEEQVLETLLADLADPDSFEGDIV
jgi:uncharacterized protein (TIGR02679 family)